MSPRFNASLVLVITIATTGCFSKAKFEDKVGPRLSHSYLNSFILDEQDSDDEISSYRFKDGERTLLVREQPMPSSHKFLADREFLIDSMYKSRQAPYPGAITVKNECDGDHKPKKAEVENDTAGVRGFQLWANSRQMYGDCTPQQQALKSLYAIIACKKVQRGFEVKIFAPANMDLPDLQTFISGFTCLQ